MRLLRLFLPGLLVCAAAFGGTDVSGKWAGGWFTITLQQDGRHITGTAGPSAKEQYAIKNGDVDGEHVTFELGTIAFDLHVDRATLKGTVKAEEQSFPVVFKHPGQTATGGPPVFDVASVKPAAAGGQGWSSRSDPGRWTFTRVTLSGLVQRAYDVKGYQVTGPDWIETEPYEVTATFPISDSMEDSQLAMQTLLAERFHLKVRRASKEMPVYALVVGKGGIRAKEVEIGPPNWSMNYGKFEAKRMGMLRLAEALSGMVDRPVIDATGLGGVYDLTLEWTPDPNRSPDKGPTLDLFGAVEQKLGLRLEKRKAPVEMLVVDSADKVPVEN